MHNFSCTRHRRAEQNNGTCVEIFCSNKEEYCRGGELVWTPVNREDARPEINAIRKKSARKSRHVKFQRHLQWQRTTGKSASVWVLSAILVEQCDVEFLQAERPAS